jgi:hypothetical protein
MHVSNTHIHTPHSFSAFESVHQAVDQAVRENVRVLGISDFNTVDGFDEFSAACSAAGVYPLFNIEFIALSEQDKQAGLRWNDPANPGNIYFCGKSLAYPISLPEHSRRILDDLGRASQARMRSMIERLNEVAQAAGVAVKLDYEQVKSRYARNTVRERHLARALADAVAEGYAETETRIAALRTLTGDVEYNPPVDDSVKLQNELRSRLLKAGKPAFVEEDPSAFLDLTAIREIILDAGGIPCYPVLADDSSPLNEHERDPEKLAEALLGLDIHAVEFIPARNTLPHLERYVTVLRDAGMCVTFGTEHNTPAPAPLIPRARGGQEFTPLLTEAAWEGACLLAAHQELSRQGKEGYVDRQGRLLARGERRREMAELGARSIASSIKNENRENS